MAVTQSVMQKENKMFDALPEEKPWNFPIEVYPTPNAITGELLPNSQQIIRTDTNEVLGVHGRSYKPVLHDDVVNSIEDAVIQSDVSKDYEVIPEVYDNGAKMRGTVHFRDLYIENKYSAEVGDIVNFRVDFMNSYDASWSFLQKSKGYRLLCKNGMVSGLAIATSKYKHTTSINIEGSANKIKLGLETFISNRDRWATWTRTKVEQEDVESFFKATVAKAFTRQRGITKTNEKQLEKLLGIYSNESQHLGPNLWALYNCLTYWSTHTSEDSRSPHITAFQREGAVENALNSAAWQKLEQEVIL